MRSCVVSVLAGAAFATGAIFLAGWLTILAGTLDILDGGLARRTGSASPRGAFVDSVVDRWAEFATFVGPRRSSSRDVWMLAVVALAAFASQMVSYVRARAEGVGIALAGGRAQRPERYVILGFGAWISGLVAHLLCPASRAAVPRRPGGCGLRCSPAWPWLDRRAAHPGSRWPRSTTGSGA